AAAGLPRTHPRRERLGNQQRPCQGGMRAATSTQPAERVYGACVDPKSLIQTFGTLGLFAMVFAESGLLVGFFLPGDSLLFTAGLLASRGSLNLAVVLVGCFLAAVAGDQVGYVIGKKTGPALFRRPESRFFHQKNVH